MNKLLCKNENEKWESAFRSLLFGERERERMEKCAKADDYCHFVENSFVFYVKLNKERINLDENKTSIPTKHMRILYIYKWSIQRMNMTLLFLRKQWTSTWWKRLDNAILPKRMSFQMYFFGKWMRLGVLFRNTIFRRFECSNSIPTKRRHFIRKTTQYHINIPCSLDHFLFWMKESLSSNDALPVICYRFTCFARLGRLYLNLYRLKHINWKCRKKTMFT